MPWAVSFKYDLLIVGENKFSEIWKIYRNERGLEKMGQWLLTTTGKLKYWELGRDEKNELFVASTMGLFFFEIYIIGL